MIEIKPLFLLKFIVQTLLVLHILAGLSSAESIRDIQPPVQFPPDLLLLYALSGILVLTAIFYLVRFLIKRFKKPKAKIAVKKLSWVAAYERLEELKRQNLPSQGKFKEYYTLLSDLVRRYIEDRFKVKAPEMTTQEFMLFLKKSNYFKAENKKLLEGFLISCDMVKFAKYGPTLNETDESFLSAKKVIDDTKETAEPKFLNH